MKTPTKSMTGGHFQSLPTLDDAALRSPGMGIFLSPHPPTPSYRSLQQSDSFDKSSGVKEAKKPKSDEKLPADAKQTSKTPMSPRTPKRDPERERFIATPTDFAMDYGKHPNSANFDTSNGELIPFYSPWSALYRCFTHCCLRYVLFSSLLVTVADCKWSLLTWRFRIYVEHTKRSWSSNAKNPHCQHIFFLF
jgi:hypothetical protein